MRITRGQLTDLINEEISTALLERQNRRLLEAAGVEDDVGPMSLDDLVDFAKKYASLSRDDRKNLDLIMDGRGEGVTPEEIRDLQIALGGYSVDLDDYLDDALNASAMYTDEDEDDGTWAAAVRANR